MNKKAAYYGLIAANFFLLVLAVAMILLIAGCESTRYAGIADYSIKNGEVSVKNGKEIGNLKAHISKNGDVYTVYLEENNVAAFPGQAIAAQTVRSSVDAAVRAAAAAALIPIAPALLPALAQPSISSAAVGAGATSGAQNLLTPGEQK